MSQPHADRPGTPFAELLDKARAGCRDSLGELLMQRRHYLLAVAGREMGAVLRQRMQAGDVVQLTFLKATKDFTRFRGHCYVGFLGWLRSILIHTLQERCRFYTTAKRDVRRVRALDEALALGPIRELLRTGT